MLLFSSFCHYHYQPAFFVKQHCMLHIMLDILHIWSLWMLKTVLGSIYDCLHYQMRKLRLKGFFYLFIFISWRLITLQYCSGFCHTLTWISHGFTCIPHPVPPPTSLSTRSHWVFPVHQAQALVSCFQPGLVICFTLHNKHVSMLFSRNIPPLPSQGLLSKDTWLISEDRNDSE